MWKNLEDDELQNMDKSYHYITDPLPAPIINHKRPIIECGLCKLHTPKHIHCNGMGNGQNTASKLFFQILVQYLFYKDDYPKELKDHDKITFITFSTYGQPTIFEQSVRYLGFNVVNLAANYKGKWQNINKIILALDYIKKQIEEDPRKAKHYYFISDSIDAILIGHPDEIVEYMDGYLKYGDKIIISAESNAHPDDEELAQKDIERFKNEDYKYTGNEDVFPNSGGHMGTGQALVDLYELALKQPRSKIRPGSDQYLLRRALHLIDQHNEESKRGYTVDYDSSIFLTLWKKACEKGIGDNSVDITNIYNDAKIPPLVKAKIIADYSRHKPDKNLARVRAARIKAGIATPEDLQAMEEELLNKELNKELNEVNDTDKPKIKLLSNPKALKKSKKLLSGIKSPNEHAPLCDIKKPRVKTVNKRFTNKEDYQYAQSDKVEVVMVSTNYLDYLKVTLPNNLKYIPNMTVVTHISDTDTINYLESIKCKYVATDAFDYCNFNRAVFNKGAALNKGLDTLDKNNWVLIMDADIYLTDPLPQVSKLDPRYLYGARRFMINSMEELERFKSYKNDYKNLNELKPQNPGIIGARTIIGYFQLFDFKTNPHYYPAIYPTASTSDNVFSFNWSMNHNYYLDDYKVLHLQTSDITKGRNWNKRITKEFK